MLEPLSSATLSDQARRALKRLILEWSWAMSCVFIMRERVSR